MITARNLGSGIEGLLSNSTFQAVLGVLILLAVCAIAVRLLSRLRDSNSQDAPVDEMLRKNFEEMKSGGYIDEAEFRNIASLLAESPRRTSLPSPGMIDIQNARKSDEE
jgi:hypothetical protein